MCHPESITADGHEIHYQVNYLSKQILLLLFHYSSVKFTNSIWSDL